MDMILVTGAAGFLGGYVCRSLAARGHDVVATDRSFAVRLPCLTEQGDLTDLGFLASLFRTCSFDAIVHLASLRNAASQQRPDEALRVNIGGSLGLLQLARQSGVPKFIFGSSISAYGPKPYSRYGQVSESEPASPDNVYGVSKRYIEVVGKQYRKQSDFQFVALRIAMAVGAGVMSTASAWRGEIFEKLRAPQHTSIHLPYAGGDFLPLVHAVDVAEMIRRLVETERTAHTIYNTPCENWQCSMLAETIASLNPNVELVMEAAATRGDPEAINGQRFVEEFGYQPTLIGNRLRSQ